MVKSDFSKIKYMLNDLQSIKNELIKNENQQETSINEKQNINTEIERYLQLKKSETKNRSLLLITKKAELNKLLQTYSKKLTPIELQQYNRMINTNSSNFISKTEIEMEKRRDERRHERQTLRQERRKKQKKNKKEDFVIIDINDDPQTNQYVQKVSIEMKDQDQLLDQIDEGLTTIKELANEANKNITIQTNMMDQMSNKLDLNVVKIKTVNSKLQDMLKQSGGLSRWCPISLCSVVLLSLLGYIFHII